MAKITGADPIFIDADFSMLWQPGPSHFPFFLWRLQFGMGQRNTQLAFSREPTVNWEPLSPQRVRSLEDLLEGRQESLFGTSTCSTSLPG